ncbi:MAG: PadR family transcriptional regulator [Cellulosilyticum sp.]|nr:PadR family transcriptional regulator [Cellulosilyticum sp.]
MANERKIDYVILGLLCHEQLTGYEIKKLLDMRLKYFWGASYGSIYPTLNTLVQNELVTKYETTENGREKIIYTITDKGRDYLKEWMALPVTKDELRYETLLKLFFGAELGGEGTLKHIDAFEEKIKEELPILHQMVGSLEAVKDEEEAHLYYLMTARFGEMVYETYVKWCKEVRKALAVKQSKM